MKRNYPTYQYALAPMAGVTDHAFRMLCRRMGADFLYTEMLSAKAICYQDKKTALLGKLYRDDAPIAVQIFGSDPGSMAEAAARIADNSYKHCISEITPAVIDINMGCPAPKLTGGGDGSGLLRTPELAGRIVRAVRDAVSLPVSVKMRIGWDENSVIGVEFAKRMEAAGADAITVHGRTREGRFHSPINFDEIRRIKEAVSVPVIGNGEIFSACDARRMRERTGCDALMIGRGSLGNPWIFRELTASGGPASVDERIDTALEQLRACIDEKGERGGILESRKQLAWYLKGIRGAAATRDALMKVFTYTEAEALLLALKNQQE